MEEHHPLPSGHPGRSTPSPSPVDGDGPRRAPSERPARGLVAGVALAVLALVVGGTLLLRGLASTGSADTLSDLSTAEQGGHGTPEPLGAVVAGPCRYTRAAAPARPVEPPVEADVVTSGRYEVALDTSAGPIAFLVDAARVPCALGSLRALSRAGYFDETSCHRLTTMGISVLQCGDPTGSGSGGPGYVFGDEALEGAAYPRGTVAMANRGPGTNGSQFFLVYADSQLPPHYTPLGRITAGLDVLDRVAAAGSDDSGGTGDGRPRTPVRVKRLTVTPR